MLLYEALLAQLESLPEGLVPVILLLLTSFGGLVALIRVNGLHVLLGGDLLVALLASDGLLLLFLLIL